MNFKTLTVLSCAKINLFLHINHKRADGYHDLVSLMCPVALYDKLTIHLHQADELSETTPIITVDCNHPLVPKDQTNLAYKAAVAFFKNLNLAKNQKKKLHIVIEKKIPVAGGLGGGSSNAAAVLNALNGYYGLPFSYEELIEMAVSLGADVPFFILNKSAIASGIGEKLKPFNNIEKFYIILICQDYIVSTAQVFKNFNFRLTKCKKETIGSFFDDNRFDVRFHLCNDLETVTLSEHRDLIEVKENLLNLGAEGALMTGSGPTIFGLFSVAEKAKKAYDSLSQIYKDRIYITNLIL